MECAGEGVSALATPARASTHCATQSHLFSSSLVMAASRGSANRPPRISASHAGVLAAPHRSRRAHRSEVESHAHWVAGSRCRATGHDDDLNGWGERDGVALVARAHACRHYLAINPTPSSRSRPKAERRDPAPSQLAWVKRGPGALALLASGMTKQWGHGAGGRCCSSLSIFPRRHGWLAPQRGGSPRSLGGRFALPRDAAMTAVINVVGPRRCGGGLLRIRA